MLGSGVWSLLFSFRGNGCRSVALYGRINAMARPLSTPRTVRAYHGCTQTVADAILSEGAFRVSENVYDWLGRGVYFWEYAPYRALEWARLVALERGDKPAVIGVTIRLGRCVNLLDTEHHEALVRTHKRLVLQYGDRLPKNTARGGHFLDRLVIDEYCDELAAAGRTIQTVRGSFAEGEPIYPGSKILSKAHTQIAVRDRSCILRTELIIF